MKNVEAFVNLCNRVIADYDAGLIDLHLAAEKINKQANEHTFEAEVHSMLYKVADLAFDIGEDYRSEEEDKANWEIIKKTIKNYVDGNWESTCWILSAIYGEHLGDKLVHSYSVAIRRLNGETITETASGELKSEFSEVIKKLNTEQTDERYLRNLAKFVPESVGKYRLVSVGVSEYLTEPYYSTA